MADKYQRNNYLVTLTDHQHDNKIFEYLLFPASDDPKCIKYQPDKPDTTYPIDDINNPAWLNNLLHLFVNQYNDVTLAIDTRTPYPVFIERNGRRHYIEFNEQVKLLPEDIIHLEHVPLTNDFVYKLTVTEILRIKSNIDPLAQWFKEHMSSDWESFYVSKTDYSAKDWLIKRIRDSKDALTDADIENIKNTKFEKTICCGEPPEPPRAPKTETYEERKNRIHEYINIIQRNESRPTDEINKLINRDIRFDRKAPPSPNGGFLDSIVGGIKSLFRK